MALSPRDLSGERDGALPFSLEKAIVGTLLLTLLILLLSKCFESKSMSKIKSKRLLDRLTE